jgi:hypothetical protein
MPGFNSPPWAALIDVKTAEAVVEAISRPRLAAYGITPDPDCDLTAVVARHGRNIVVSESLYPLLHLLELVLRNRVHDAFRAHFGTDEWFRQPWLDAQERKQVEKAEADLKAHRYPTNPDDVVAALTFGFWCALFNRRYESSHGRGLWPHLLRAVVPRAPRYARTREQLQSRLEKARRVRNRVFHHEPIAHWNNLASQYADLVELLGWFSPEAREHLAHICRFKSVWADTLVPRSP